MLRVVVLRLPLTVVEGRWDDEGVVLRHLRDRATSVVGMERLSLTERPSACARAQWARNTFGCLM